MEALTSVKWECFLQQLESQSVVTVAKEICDQHHIDQAEAKLLVTNVLSSFAKAMYPLQETDQSNGEEQEEQRTQRQHAAAGQLVQQVVQQAIQQKLLGQELAHDAVIDLFNYDMFCERLDNLRKAFPEPFFLHALAVKSNPVRGVLSIAQAKGLGAECASFAEAKHALALGFEPRKIIYDSPCKTLDEMKELLLNGIYINLDNEQEIGKMQRILHEIGGNFAESKANEQIGLRINPIVGGGTIAATSTATATSKFGLPLSTETADRIFTLYQTNPWLQGVHVHVGSQGCELSLLARGAQRAYEFAVATNKRLGREQIRVIDIGGGMPTLYDGVHEAYGFEQYAQELRKAVPGLFDGKFRLVTEFGRSVFVKSGITVSRVEAVKDWVGQHIAVIHVGANQFIRTAYLPKQWPHVLTVFSKDGQLKSESFIKQDIAGPLCFSGDFVAKQRLLPWIATGDFVVIHDSGGYTLSMYSKYNSRSSSAVFAYRRTENGSIEFAKMRDRESLEETLAFWGINGSVF